jgi:hypothetical protein
MRYAIAIAALALTGCAAGLTVPADPSKMTPDQLNVWVRDRNANVSCITTDSLWAGRITTTWVVLDRGTVTGEVRVTADCEVSITARPAP